VFGIATVPVGLDQHAVDVGDADDFIPAADGLDHAASVRLRAVRKMPSQLRQINAMASSVMMLWARPAASSWAAINASMASAVSFFKIVE
jgi:hypothetical protein